jgi:hypothetical protein
MCGCNHQYLRLDELCSIKWIDVERRMHNMEAVLFKDPLFVGGVKNNPCILII